ncbi:unnamed protein product [Dibothriocephalus latus]|uniref:Uncharacterized protein n=1 Tax=Dibothriocephalus latus TaxID=60516 RepID=A0A3P7LUE0_DIBLA|nr:unnamed protein product [Dibothriocephalus latus]
MTALTVPPFFRLNELRRDLQARLHLGNDRELVSDRILLSQEVAINMLDDVRQSAKRCMIVSPFAPGWAIFFYCHKRYNCYTVTEKAGRSAYPCRTGPAA